MGMTSHILYGPDDRPASQSPFIIHEIDSPADRLQQFPDQTTISQWKHSPRSWSACPTACVAAGCDVALCDGKIESVSPMPSVKLSAEEEQRPG